MTDATANLPDRPPPPPPAPKPRSYLASVVFRTLGRVGALLGFAWLMVVTVFAIFAPLLASSHPLYLETVDGRRFSPWLQHLTAADVILPIAALGAALVSVLARRRPFRLRLGLTAAWIGIVTAAGLALVRPPEVVVYDRWREMDRRGEVVRAVLTPIPYSAGDRMRDMPERKLTPPGTDHWLGTTLNNADQLSRLIHASRLAMSIGFIATGIALCIGVSLGALMGYFSRAVDLLGMRLVEVFEAIPSLYLLLAFVAFFGRNLYLMMVIIGLVSWTGYTRFTRAEFLKLRAMDYVTATRALGLPLWSTLFRHMLPNGLAPVLVTASFGVASAILAESFLSFIGLGVVDEPSWGQLLSQAISAGGGFIWWIAIFPGLMIFLTVFAFNLIGESLRDAIDPNV